MFNNIFPKIHKEGYKFLAISIITTFIVLIFSKILGLFLILITAWVYYFFRDPERFPINDPYLKPIIKPRPVSDALFLHGLLEGLSKIELKGWLKLKSLSGYFPRKIITIGGGSKNPQWKSIREKTLNIPVVSCNKSTAFGSALIALQADF